MQIQLLVGMICSHKSTYANLKAKEGWLIINDDAIVSAVHGGTYSLYDKKLKPLYKGIENTIFNMAILAGKNVIIDRGLSVSKDARQRWIAMARAYDLPIDAVIFRKEPAEVHAKRRFEKDSRGLSYEHWLRAAQRHESIWVTPTREEGFDRVITFHDENGNVFSIDYDLEKAKAIFKAAMKNEGFDPILFSKQYHGRLTDLYVSPESLKDIQQWDMNETNKELYDARFKEDIPE